MAGKSTALEAQMLAHIFNNAAIADIGNIGGLPVSTVDGDLYVSLHTGTLVDGDNQSASETTYTNYARVAVSRTGSTGWTLTGSSISPTADIDFAECGVTPGGPVTHFAIGKEGPAGAATEVLYWGALTPSITMATGVIPRIKTTSTVTED